MLRRINSKFLIVIIITLLLFAAGFYVYDLSYNSKTIQQTISGPPYRGPEMASSAQFPITDNMSLYTNDENGKVIDIYVTMLKPDNPKYSTLNDILAYKYNYTEVVEKPAAKAVFQIGNENGPEMDMLGFDPKVANAIIEPRGRSTSASAYKSFKISLSDKVALWGGQKVLNLNFHPSDRSRIRNKLSFDFYELMPDITSLRTQFVRLHIKDNSEGAEGEFVEYGLFTHVEQVNKRYLSSHGLDGDGHLYKANSFEFHRYMDVIKLKTDPSYDANAFNQVLDIRGNEDHSKLIDMLIDLNDSTKDIDDIIEAHFNRDNYLTWLASNIITGNSDTVSQNFILYSPQAIKNWYFIPWDCDGAWGWAYEVLMIEGEERYAEWQYGIQNLWGSKLSNRFLRKKENVEQLDQKIQELMKLYNEERTNKFLTEYYPEVLKSQSTPEALMKLRSSPTRFAESYNLLPTIPKKYYDIYVSSKQKPMPFFQNPVEMRDGSAYFSWGSSFDLQNDQLTYTLEVSKTPDMQTIVYTQKDLSKPEASADLESGTYYMKVRATDSQGNSMGAFDQFRDLDDVEYDGVREVKVEKPSE